MTENKLPAEHQPKVLKKASLAQEAYANYCFGDGVTVEGDDGWDATDQQDLTRVVYVHYDSDDSKEPTHKISFHVRFSDDDALAEIYALEMNGGNLLGYSPMMDEIKAQPVWRGVAEHVLQMQEKYGFMSDTGSLRDAINESAELLRISMSDKDAVEACNYVEEYNAGEATHTPALSVTLGR